MSDSFGRSPSTRCQWRIAAGWSLRLKAAVPARSSAFNRSDHPAAIRHWKRVLGLLPKESDMTQRVQASIAEARSLAGSPGGKTQVAKPAQARGGSRVSGVVRLAPEPAGKVSPGDTG